MSYTLKTQQVAVKDPETGTYSGVDVLTEQTKSGLLAEIQAEGAAQRTSVTNTGTTQVSAVQAKGAETLASIPSDYTTLSNDVDDLKNTFSAFYKNSEVFTSELSYTASTELPQTVVYNGLIPSGVSYKVEATTTGGVSRIDIKLGSYQTYNTPNVSNKVVRNETASTEINTILVSIPSDKVSASGMLTVVITVANPIDEKINTKLSISDGATKNEVKYMTDNESFTTWVRTLFSLKIWYNVNFRNQSNRLSITTPLCFPFDVTFNNPFYAIIVYIWSSGVASSDTLISQTVYYDKECTIKAGTFFTITYSKANNVDFSSASESSAVYAEATIFKNISSKIEDGESKFANAFTLSNNLTWEQGRYSATHGGAESTNQRIRTTGYIPDTIGIIFGGDDYQIELLAWFNNVFIGTYKGGFLFEKTTTGTLMHSKIDLTKIKNAFPQYQYKLTIKKGDGTADLATTEGANIYTGEVYTIPNVVDYDSIIRSVNRIADDLPVPHQSIAGYKYAYSLGFRNMLCDLRFTSDITPIPICQHDAYMNENYSDVYLNGSIVPKDPPVYFADLTYADLQAYDFGVYKGAQFSGTKILSLEQMLKLCKFLGCCVYLEMKVYPMTTAQFDAVFALIRKYGMEKNVVWAPQSIYAVNQLHEYEPNVYIQFHSNTAGQYTDIPDTYISAIVNATNDYNRGHNTILVPLSVGISDAQMKSLSDAGVGLCGGYTTWNTHAEYIDRWITERPAYIESLSEHIIVGRYVYEKMMRGEITI